MYYLLVPVEPRRKSVAAAAQFIAINFLGGTKRPQPLVGPAEAIRRKVSVRNAAACSYSIAITTLFGSVVADVSSMPDIPLAGGGVRCHSLRRDPEAKLC